MAWNNISIFDLDDKYVWGVSVLKPLIQQTGTAQYSIYIKLILKIPNENHRKAATFCNAAKQDNQYFMCLLKEQIATLVMTLGWRFKD